MRSLIKSSIWILVMGVTACSSGKKEAETTREEPIEAEPIQQKPIIMFFGNSITAGYGLDLDQAFPAIIQKKLDSLGHDYQVVNAGLSGETSAGGLNRVEWVLRTVPEIFVLELGANDGLRGLKLAETKRNLQTILDKVKEVNPEVKLVLAGMEVPPNLGDDYTSQFRKMFAELASENDITFIRFILDGVAGNPSLNLPDGIHPTAEGHLIVAETVWYALKTLLEPKISS